MHNLIPSVVRSTPILLVLLSSTACIGCNDAEALKIARQHGVVQKWADPPHGFKIDRDIEAANAVIPYLPELRSIERIEIIGVPLTENQVKLIGEQTSILHLYLRNCNIDDSDLSHLAKLTDLKELRLPSNPIKGEGLKHLEDLTKLTLLDLGATQISGKGLQVVKKMPRLRELRVSGSNLNDNGVDVLVATQSKIRTLTASGTDITRDGYLRLASLVWLTNASYSYDIAGSSDDPQKSHQARQDLRKKFLDLQQKAIERAREKGMETPEFAGAPR